MSSDRKPRLVPLYALGIAYVAVRVLVTQLSGEPGGLKILLVLAGVALLAATARGLLQYRGWAWLVTIVAMVLGLMVGQVRIWLAVDQGDYTEMKERMLEFAGDPSRVIPGLDAEQFRRFPSVAEGVVRIKQ